MKTLTSALIIVLIASSCSQKKTSEKSNSIMTSLQNIEGEFVVSDETGTPIFSKNDDVTRILETHADQKELVHELIKNIDNKEASKSTYNSDSVSLGEISLHALRLQIYYEHYGNSEDIKPWKGNTALFSDSLDLSEIKNLWMNVYNQNLYKQL